MYTRHFFLLSWAWLLLSVAPVNALPKSKKQKKESQAAAVPPDNTSDESVAAQAREQIELIELENALNKARLEKELAALQAEVQRLVLEKERIRLQEELEREKTLKAHEKEMLTLRQQKEKLQVEIELSKAKIEKAMEKFQLASTELANKVNLVRIETEQLQAEVNQLNAKKQRANYANGKALYLKEPLQKGGTLVLSDRRVDLNGVITAWKANHVVDRIQYFNNKNTTYPIFIVIESSPGGSVLAGWRILKAMKNSQAPVYVVLKSWAASMAACITTLADRSYAYPNAEILHHQPSRFYLLESVNVREQEEAHARMQELWKRLGGPVAKKMGISLQSFDKKLYEKSAKGDWSEFADKAKKIKWVDHIITGIKDSGMREMPNPANYTFGEYLKEYDPYFEYSGADSVTPTDHMIYLPPLPPNDFYYLYNPYGRYQLRSTK